MKNFTKVVHVGCTENGETFCKIVFKDGRLSITGVEGPLHNGNARGSCGQIIMHDLEFIDLAPGWGHAMAIRFQEIWVRWHLNDMCAGSPAQAEYLRQNDIQGYDEACKALETAGLQPDPNYPHNGKPYRYGSAWLREDVPEDVLEWLAALPDTDTQPAWV